MGSDSFSIVFKDGCHYLQGVLNEYADFEPLKMASEPLRLDFSGLNRLNSIGVRNFLRFLNHWGSKELYYENASAELIDQINMIPSMRGVAKQARIMSFRVPWQCLHCEHEDEILMRSSDIEPVLEAGQEPTHKCPKCNQEMALMADSYFDFLLP